MNVKIRATVIGVRKFNDVVDGVKYDFTKLRVQMPVNTNSGNEVGFDVQDIPYGEHSNFDSLRNLPFPVVAELDVELTTKGMVCHRIQPVAKSQEKAA